MGTPSVDDAGPEPLTSEHRQGLQHNKLVILVNDGTSLTNGLEKGKMDLALQSSSSTTASSPGGSGPATSRVIV